MCGHNEDLATDSGHFAGGGFQVLRLAAGNGDFRAGFGETVGDPLADAAAAAGHNGHFTLQ